MVGGVIDGNWATGRRLNATPPARTIRIDSTEAKIGRSMKKREIMIVRRQWSVVRGQWLQALRALLGSGLFLLGSLALGSFFLVRADDRHVYDLGSDGDARTGLLQAADDDFFA